MKSFSRTEIGERVEQSDFDFATNVSIRKVLQSIMQDFVTGTTRPNMVLDGFASDDGYGDLPGTVVTINSGRAIMGHRSDTQEFGVLVSEGADSRNVDLNGRAEGTYGVYVRACFLEDEFSNRLLWNALAATPVETPRSMATRFAVDWELAIELTSPGSEYMLVAQAVKVGSTITLTDKREWAFEGNLANSYTVPDSEWGATADRNTDRAAAGVKDLRTTVRAIQKQLQSIIGESSAGWYKTIDRNLKQLVALNGSRSMSGSLLPDTDQVIDLGSTSFRWNFGYLWNVITSVIYFDKLVSTVAEANQPRIVFAPNEVAGVERMSLLTVDGTSVSKIRLFWVVGGGLEITGNANWNNTTDLWAADSNGSARSWRLQIGVGGNNLIFSVWAQSAGATWAEGAWTQPGVLKHSIPGFAGSTPNPDKASTLDGIGFYRDPAEVGAVTVVWPIHLPNGSIITGAIAKGLFANNGNGLQIAVVRVDDSGTITTLDSGTEAAIPDGATATAVVNQNATVNNDTHSYFLRIRNDQDAGADDEWDVYRIEVTYTAPDLTTR